MNPVGDEKCGQLVAREKPLDHVGMPRQFGGNAVPEMRAKSSARPDGRVNHGIRGIRVAEGNLHAGTHSMLNDLRAARLLWSQGQQFDMAAGGLLKAVEIRDIWQSHVPGVMSATVSGLQRKPRTLDVIPAGSFGDERIGGPDPFDVLQLCAKRADSVSDQRQEKPQGFVRGQPVHRVPEIGGRQIRPLEIHAREPVDLDIKQAGFHPIKRGLMCRS